MTSYRRMKASCEALLGSLVVFLTSEVVIDDLEKSGQSGGDGTLDELSAVTGMGVVVVSGAMWAGNGKVDRPDRLA